MFGQIDATTAAGTASSILSDRSDAMVILCGVMALIGFWLWKIHLPWKQSEQKLREADKEIHQTNAATLKELSRVTTTVHDTTLHSDAKLNAVIEVKEIELNAMGKVALAADCDIREELAEARGVLRLVRSGATTLE